MTNLYMCKCWKCAQRPETCYQQQYKLNKTNNIITSHLLVTSSVKPKSHYCTAIVYQPPVLVTNFLLTEREGRTGEYWPEVVAVRTERSEVRTKTTEGQYSSVRSRASEVSK